MTTSGDKPGQGRGADAQEQLGAKAATVLVGLAGTAAVAIPDGCDVETTYHCLAVRTDPARDTGRILVLDGLRNSYVDLEDPTYLDFEYVQAMASVIDGAFAPGTASVVSEIDAGAVQANTERLGGELADGIEVRAEDARLALNAFSADRFDIVVGDAFGGVSALRP